MPHIDLSLINISLETSALNQTNKRNERIEPNEQALTPTMSVNNPYDKPNSRMGLSQKALAGRQTAKVWIGKYLQSDANTNYPATFGELTVEYLEEENMTIFFECIGLWLATGNFPTRQNTFLTVDVKVEYFKLIKEVLKENHLRYRLRQQLHQMR